VVARGYRQQHRAEHCRLNRFEFAPWMSSVLTRDEVTFMAQGGGILRLLTDWQVAKTTCSSSVTVGPTYSAGGRVRVAIIRDGECGKAAFADARPTQISGSTSHRSHRRTQGPHHGPVIAGASVTSQFNRSITGQLSRAATALRDGEACAFAVLGLITSSNLVVCRREDPFTAKSIYLGCVAVFRN
jgi:hypothetical protein